MLRCQPFTFWYGHYVRHAVFPPATAHLTARRRSAELIIAGSFTSPPQICASARKQSAIQSDTRRDVLKTPATTRLGLRSLNVDTVGLPAPILGAVEAAIEPQGAIATRMAPSSERAKRRNPLRYSVVLLCQFA
jgi:hypothetical protein